jgi:hypothetical protein
VATTDMVPEETDRSARFARSQHEGLAALLMASRKQELANEPSHARGRADNSFIRNLYAGLGFGLPAAVAKRKVTAGALAARYELPCIRAAEWTKPFLAMALPLVVSSCWRRGSPQLTRHGRFNVTAWFARWRPRSVPHDDCVQ